MTAPDHTHPGHEHNTAGRRRVIPISFTALAGTQALPVPIGAKVLGWSAVNNTAAAALLQLFDGGNGANGQNLWSETVPASAALGRSFGHPGVDVQFGLFVVTGASMTGTVLVFEEHLPN